MSDSSTHRDPTAPDDVPAQDGPRPGHTPAPAEGRKPARSPLEGTAAVERVRERDLDDEIQAHLAHRVDDLVSEGLPVDEAWAQARKEFGDTARIKAESRAVRQQRDRMERRRSALEATRQDVGWTLRQVRRAPGFAGAALAALALGIGAAVTIASVVSAVVFEPLPFDAPGEVVYAEMLTPEREPFAVSEPVLLDWRREVSSFEDVGAVAVQSAVLRSPGQPRAIRIGRVTHDLLEVLGLQPVRGRGFTAGEDGPGMAAPVALLSSSAWRSEFGSDPDVVGAIIDIDGTRHEVVGVMPEALEVITREVPVFVPMGPDPAMPRGEHYIDVYARLAPGATVETAAAELVQVQDRISRTHGADLGWSARLRPVRDVLVGDTVERAGWILLLAAGLLLVMACINVSNLLMVRATVRRGEMALRAALGASRRRLVGQLFTESGVLAAVGGALGILFAWMALPTVKALGAAQIPRLQSAQMDGRAVLVGVAAAVLATLVCGLAPVVQLRSDRLGHTIGAGRARMGDPGRKLRSVFVTGQIALTVVLLAGTGLLLRSFVELSRVDPGFEPEQTLAFSMDMPDGSWSWDVRRDMVPRLREAIASVPGVVAVGGTAVEPFSGIALANFVAPEENLPDRAADFTPIQWRVVTPGFFEAMGMELLAGRAFRDSDDWEGGTPVVIGRSLAEATWGDDDPIGRRLVWNDPQGSRMTVVGVVEDLRDVELGETPPPIVYRPHRQIPWATMTVVLRVAGEDPRSVIAGVREQVATVAPGLPIGEVAPLTRHLDRAVATPRFNLQLLSVFAVVGLILALVGVWGLTAFDVRRRFGEIGIRLSLGARPEGIQSMILRERMTVTAVGVGVGLVVAWVVTRAMESLLYGITPNDPTTWVGVTSLVALAALVATYLPARKATHVDPREILNTE